MVRFRSVLSKRRPKVAEKKLYNVLELKGTGWEWDSDGAVTLYGTIFSLK
jgi:hypothetical protein